MLLRISSTRMGWRSLIMTRTSPKSRERIIWISCFSAFVKTILELSCIWFTPKTKKLRQYNTAAAAFLRNNKSPLPIARVQRSNPIPVGLLTYVSSDNLSAFSRFLSMTDFRQRQAISTLTAPAARGLTPHYLVQPGTRHALYPATGTTIKLSINRIIAQTG